MDFVCFLIAVPVTVELLGAMLSIADARARADARAAAVERLAVPLLCWGALWWVVGPEGWTIVFGALVLVIVAHAATFYLGRWLLTRPAFQTRSVDTDVENEGKRAPATMGIGKGERNSSPGRTRDTRSRA